MQIRAHAGNGFFSLFVKFASLEKKGEGEGPDPRTIGAPAPPPGLPLI